MTLERGTLLNKRYRIVEILGQGGMGSIYRAVDENLGVNVAVKENLFTTEDYARQFRREAVILATLRHPNLPRVTDHFVINGQGQYLVMDYIEGEDLRERMDRLGVLSDKETSILGVAICDALSYLHSRTPHVVHRDIKPGNVKVSPAGNIVLVDFGLAKIIHGGQATTTGARAMTPGYSPPEQYGTARTDHRTDIYALGATLYVALTGVVPEDALARAMEQAELTPIRRLNPKVSRRLAVVVEKALELRPEDRYQSAEDFKQALLIARRNTGRRSSRELTVAPPPAAPPGPVRSENGVSSPLAISKEDVWSSSQAGVGSSLLPAGPPLAAELAIPRPKRRRRLGCLLTLISTGLIFLIAVGVYYYQPYLNNQALSWIAALLPSSTTPIMEGSPSIERPLPVAFETDIPSVTLTPQLNDTQFPPLSFTPIPTATKKPTPTQEPTDTPTPTITPVGGGWGEIAFASNRGGLPQIWLMNVDGTAHRQITEMPEGACQPSWSPDGMRLVFISPCAFNQETYPGASLFIINVDGTGLTPLPTVPGGDFDPAWSPGGTRIAFTSLRDYNRAQVYVIDLEDNSVKSLSANKVRDSQPFWSPDGRLIVFVSTRRGPFQVWMMASDGGDHNLLSRSGSLKNTHPVWSPDGNMILFTQSEVLGGVPRLVAARLDISTYSETKVVPDATPMKEGVFSSDGFWLAYESWPEGNNHDIYVMTVNGLARQRLTTDPALDFDPAWRPAPKLSDN